MAFNELRAIATFVKAAELGSLRRAAAAQAISPQAASLSLAQLEAHLGLRLFHRSTRSLALTEEGARFLEAARPGLHSLQLALLGTREQRGRIAGPLRIAAPRAFAQTLLWPLLESFCRRHPEVEPDLRLDDQVRNWIDDRVDVGLRAGPPPSEGLIARRLLPLQLIVCASPAYIAAHGRPTRIEQLAGHRCSGFRHPDSGKLMAWVLQQDGELQSRDIAAQFVCNDIELEQQAVLAGLCIGQLVGVNAVPLLRAGRLLPLLPETASEQLGLYLYYGSRVAQPARVRAFVDHAAAWVAAQAPQWRLAPEELARLARRRVKAAAAAGA